MKSGSMGHWFLYNFRLSIEALARLCPGDVLSFLGSQELSVKCPQASTKTSLKPELCGALKARLAQRSVRA